MLYRRQAWRWTDMPSHRYASASCGISAADLRGDGTGADRNSPCGPCDADGSVWLPNGRAMYRKPLAYCRQLDR